MKKHIQIAIAAALTLGAASAAQAQTILHNWQFNETVGTAITGTVNTGTQAASGGAWNGANGNIATTPGVQTNGSGALVFTNAAANSNVWLSTTDLNYDLAGGNPGIYQVEARISAWNLDSLAADATGLYIGFVSSNNGTAVAADFNITRTAGGNTQLGARIGGTTVTVGQTFTGLTGSDLLIRLIIDATTATKTVTLQYNLAGDGWNTAIAAMNFGDQSRDLMDFRVRQSGNLTGGNITLDYLTITQVPEPSSAAALAGLGALGLVCLRRRRRA